MGLVALARFATLIALRRTAADWRLQAAAGFGMVLAVTLIASGVIYSKALEETALRYSLRNVPVEELDLAVTVFHALERPAFDATNRFVGDRVHQPLSRHFPDSTLLLETSTLYFTGLPHLDQPNSERPRGGFQAVPRLEDRARVVEGRLPRPAYGEVEIALDPLGASVLGLSVEQRFHAFSAISGDQEKALPVRVVGIIEPLELSDLYWQLGNRHKYVSTERTQWIAAPLYADMDALFDTVATALPGLRTDFIWRFFIDLDGLSGSEVGGLRSTIRGVKDDLRSNMPNSRWDTGLSEVLERYVALLVLARIPLFLVIFLAIGVLFYYLFLITGLMGRVRMPEVALFRSRGASTTQVGVVILVEGLLLAVPAIAIGPFLAQVLVLLTGRLFPVASGGQGLASVDLSPSVFLLGAVGALLAVVVLTATTLGWAHRGMVAFRWTSARPPEIPFLHRYYLDLALLAFIGMLWWQLSSRGTFLVQPLSGESMEIDVTLFLGPVLGVVAGGLLLFRLFPIALKVVARLAEPFAPVWLVHSLRHMARDPVPSGSLLVLLALATSLGSLGSAIITTLEHSQREQALYEAGADVRIRHSLGTQVAAGQSVALSLSSLPGVAAASDAMRLETSVTTSAFPRATTFLAVDTGAFPRVAWYRADFAGPLLAQALQPLEPAEVATEGIPIPSNATDLGIWVRTGRLSRSTTLLARLQDSQGTYFDVVLGELSGQEWRYLEAPVQPTTFGFRSAPPPVVVPPYTLRTLRLGSIQGGNTAGAIALDQLQAITPEGPVELESFQSVERWHPLEDALTPGLYSLELSEAVARPGRRSAVFTWGGGGLALRGIQVGSPETPLPALVSPSFLDANQVQESDTVSVYLGSVLAPVEIVGLAEFFPTLNPHETPFVVTDLSAVLDYLALHSSRPTYSGMEVWVRSASGSLDSGLLHRAIEESGGSILETYEVAGMIATRTSDPLLTAGWSGLLALSFFVVVLASASGLILFTYIDSRARLGEFAVLRSVGFSHRQVSGVVWFALALMVVSGLGVGTWGGQWLGSAILPLLEVAEAGTRITPPMVLQNNWPALGLAYLVLVGAALVAVVALAWAIGRLEVQRLLRAVET